jgi:hypothetical protein
MPIATTTTPLLTASPPHLRPPNIPPIFPDLESQAAYFRARSAEEATFAARFRRWFVKNAVLVLVTVAVAAFVVFLAVFFGGGFSSPFGGGVGGAYVWYITEMAARRRIAE